MSVKYNAIRTSTPELRFVDGSGGSDHALGAGSFYVTGSAGGLVPVGTMGLNTLEWGLFQKHGAAGGAKVDFYISTDADYPNTFHLPNQNAEFTVLVGGKNARLTHELT